MEGGEWRLSSDRAPGVGTHAGTGEDAKGKGPMRRGVRRVWIVTGAVLAAAAGGLALSAPSSDARVLVTLALVLWGLATAAAVARRVWRRLTYRIGVRLFLSYLLVSVLPFLLFAVIVGLAGYMLVGQYTSARFGELEVRVYRELQRTVSRAADEAEDGGDTRAVAFLEEAAVRPPGEIPALEWIYEDRGRTWSSEGVTGVEVPGWVAGVMWSGPVLVGQDRTFLAAVQRRGARAFALLVPLDLATARKIDSDNWFSVRFKLTRLPGLGGGESGEGLNITLGASPSGSTGTAPGGRELRVQGELVPPADIEPGWIPRGVGAGGFLAGRWVVWFRVGRQPRVWATGAMDTSRRTLALLKSSPEGAFSDLFGSPYRLRSEFLGAIGGVTLAFAVLYAFAVLAAAVMIVSITRSTARLSRGAREIARGHLDHLIPVKRRDQLGELAVSFNAMTASVRSMLAEVKEKERLDRELELAREIQQSLLPRREVRHGPFTVDAHFRPAAEVGGDYFDVFELPGGRLLVTLGDVAGHGLPTGLLMAMVKSAVATLVRGGHRGAGLLRLLNELVLEQSLRRRMVTLTVVEIDPEEERLEVTSAGHPPVLVVAPSGDVDEVLLASLPVGYRWEEPPPSAVRPFPAGSRLVLYSDGLVEVRNTAGDAFGWEGLRGAIASCPGCDGGMLAAEVMRSVEDFLGGAAASDDITLIVVDRPAAKGGAGDGPEAPRGGEDG